MNVFSVCVIVDGVGMLMIGIYSYFKGKQGILDVFYIEGFELVECEMLVVDGNIVVEKVINGCECILMFLEIYVVYY